MHKFITFGNWNKYYLYIIGTSISLIIYRLITGYSYIIYESNIFKNEENSGHFYIHEFEYYFMTFFCAFLFRLYERKRNESTQTPLYYESSNLNIINKQDLIYNKIYEYDNINISNKFVYLNIFLFVFMSHIETVYSIYFKNCDFWMFQLIILAYLNMREFKIKIYKHQFFALCTVSVPVIIKIATIIIAFEDENNQIKAHDNYKYDVNDEENNLLVALYVVHGWLIPIAIIFYFVIIIIKSYAIINIKIIMDLKYVSITKVLILFGEFGCIFSFLLLIIFSFISGGKKNDKIYDLYDYQFKVIYNNERYIDNIRAYFKVDIWKDILISFFGGIAISVYRLFVFRVIQYLTPIHQGFSLPIFYFLEKVSLAYNIKYTDKLYYINRTFALDLTSDVAAIIGFLIYLEIIELNFCDLNNDLRKYIILRGKKESKNYTNENRNDDSISNISECEISDLNALEDYV